MMHLLYEDNQMQIDISENKEYYIITDLIGFGGYTVINKNNNEVITTNSTSEMMDIISRLNNTVTN